MPISRRLGRGLLIVAVFGLLAVLSIFSGYVADHISSAPRVPMPPADPKPFAATYWSAVRYYVIVAAWAPLIVWLGRRVPLLGPGLPWRLTFHLATPFVLGMPFFLSRIVISNAFSLSPASQDLLARYWWRLSYLEAAGFLPIYWLILSASLMVQIARDAEARRLRAVELRRSLSGAQLDALRMQLQPHFLFSALETIGTLARSRETAAVGAMVDHLGTMLRLSMDAGTRPFVPLADEWRVLEPYLAIEALRHPGRFVVHTKTEAGLERALVPSLLLHPLVEYAINQPVGPQAQPQRLEITATQRAGQLLLSVRDNGPGLPPGWSLPSDGSPGVRNVLARIDALFSGRASLTVTAADGGGTNMTLALPLVVDTPAPQDA